MSRDRNNRSHKAKGQPDGGQYEHEHITLHADNDLTPPYPDKHLLQLILQTQLPAWQQDEYQQHKNDNNWLHHQYDQLTLQDDPDPHQALTILNQYAQTINPTEPTITLHDQPIPISIIHQFYNEDPDSLNRLLIRIYGSQQEINQLEQHADDSHWLSAHAQPYTPPTLTHINQSTTSANDPWAQHDSQPFTPPVKPTTSHINKNPVDTKPIWDQPLDTHSILHTATTLLNIQHTYTLTSLHRQGNTLHVSVNDTDEHDRHRIITITNPQQVNMIEDGMQLTLGSDQQWHIIQTARSKPASTHTTQSSQKSLHTQPTTNGETVAPQSRPASTSPNHQLFARGTLLKGIFDFTIGLYKGTKSIVNDARQHMH